MLTLRFVIDCAIENRPTAISMFVSPEYFNPLGRKTETIPRFAKPKGLVFQSTRSQDRDVIEIVCFEKIIIFQSTRSQDRDVSSFHAELHIYISIHSVARPRLLPSIGADRQGAFQSTRSQDRDQGNSNSFSRCTISIHSVARPRPGTKLPFGVVAIFQSTRSQDRDEFWWDSGRGDYISIHSVARPRLCSRKYIFQYTYISIHSVARPRPSSVGSSA